MNQHALEATRAVDKLVSQWRAAPPVRVVEIVDDLPCRVYDDTKGMLHRGQAWIVANACTKSEVIETLAHEAIGHHAMRQALGSLWRPFMQALHAGARDDAKLSLLQRSVTRDYVDSQKNCYLPPVGQGDEMAARLAELSIKRTGRLGIQNPMLKVSKAVVGHLSREGLFLNTPADFDELEGNLALAEHKLRYGGHFWGVGFLLKRWHTARMAKPWNPRDVPMTLDESERLLKAEKDRIGASEDRKALGQILVGLVCLVMIPVCLVVMASGFVDALQMLFR